MADKHAFLSDDWFAEVARLVAEHGNDATPPHANVTVNLTVTDTPFGDERQLHMGAKDGQGAVAGHPCTEWQALDRQGRAALVCITEDGVLLRAGTPAEVRVSAISVQYAPQDAAAFRVPADYARVAPGASP